MPVKVSDYFEVIYGVNLELIRLKKSNDGINFVSRTGKNNGVSAKVIKIDSIIPNPKNTISVACGGSVMESFLQKEEYYSGRDIYYLKPKIELNEKKLLFYCMCLRKNKFRYSYGRQPNRTLEDISIPSIKEIPFWVEEIKIPIPPTKDKILFKDINLKLKRCGIFKIRKLFDVEGSKTTPKNSLLKKGKGNFQYVTTKSSNNGVDGFYNYHTEEDNVLTIDSAVVGFCSYRDSKFSASDHVEKLSPKFKLNIYIGIFLSKIINLEQFRYNYGRKFNQDRIKETKIKLPIDSEGNPDWQFMENYIKSLPYSKALTN